MDLQWQFGAEGLERKRLRLYGLESWDAGDPSGSRTHTQAVEGLEHPARRRRSRKQIAAREEALAKKR